MTKIINYIKKNARNVINKVWCMTTSKQEPPMYPISDEWKTWIECLKENRMVRYKVEYHKLEINDREFKWVGAIYHKRKVYGIANGTTNCLVYDTDKESFETIGELEKSPFQWTAGGVWNDRIYGFPRSSNYLMIINENKIILHNMGTKYSGEHHYGGVITDRGILYQPPRNTNHILKINLNNLNVDKINVPGILVKHRYCGSVYHPNGLIYFLPEAKERIMVLDTKNDKIYFIGKPISTKVFAAVTALDGNIYGFSAYGLGLLRISVNDNRVDMLYNDISFKCYGTELGMNGLIYGIPGDGKFFFEYDISRDKLEIIGEAMSGEKAKCAGAAVDIKGDIITIPAKGNYVYVLKPDKNNRLQYNKWLNNFY